ncbi:hypothetical protein GCM10028805_33170 [Spirosoma harenae]
MEEAFFQKNKLLNAQVFLSVGSLEGDVMIPFMIDFANSPKSHHYKGLQLSSTSFDNETHLSVIPAMLSRTLRVLYELPMK